MSNHYIESTLRVRYQETDQMGVVYYANYLVWFEVGRSEFIRSKGWSYQQFEERGLFLPVIDAHCRYYAPARYDEEVNIQTQVTDFTGSKLCFLYEVYEKQHQTLLAKGSTVHIWVDQNMKRINIENQFPEILQKLEMEKKEEDEQTCSG